MKTLLLAALLLPAPSATEPPKTEHTAPLEMPRTMPVLGEARPGCMPIVQQVSGEKREYRGTRLDQQPPARMLFAVDRQVNGCHEATFVNQRRIEGEGRR